MKSILMMVTLISFSFCTKKVNNYSKETVKLPVVYKYETTHQFSIFPHEEIWIAKLSNGDSIKMKSIPPDTITFIYYKKVK